MFRLFLIGVGLQSDPQGDGRAQGRTRQVRRNGAGGLDPGLCTAALRCICLTAMHDALAVWECSCVSLLPARLRSLTDSRSSHSGIALLLRNWVRWCGCVPRPSPARSALPSCPVRHPSSFNPHSSLSSLWLCATLIRQLHASSFTLFAPCPQRTLPSCSRPASALSLRSRRTAASRESNPFLPRACLAAAFP